MNAFLAFELNCPDEPCWESTHGFTCSRRRSHRTLPWKETGDAGQIYSDLKHQAPAHHIWKRWTGWPQTPHLCISLQSALKYSSIHNHFVRQVGEEARVPFAYEGLATGTVNGLLASASQAWRVTSCSGYSGPLISPSLAYRLTLYGRCIVGRVMANTHRKGCSGRSFQATARYC